MANRYKEIIGSWVTLVGTIIAALGVTPAIVDGGFFLEDGMTDEQKKEKADLLSDQLTFLGNAMQGLGNATEAVGEAYSIEKAGEMIQAAGNTTVLFAIDTIDDERKRVTLDIMGNLLQSFGGLIVGLDELKDYSDDYYKDAIGNLLQSLGNAIQAVGGLVFLRSEIQEETNENNDNNEESKENEVNSEDKRNKGKNGDEEDDGNKENEEIEKLSELIIYIGSWVQSGGAIVSAVATTHESLKKIAKEGTIVDEDGIGEIEDEVVRKYGYGYF